MSAPLVQVHADAEAVARAGVARFVAAVRAAQAVRGRALVALAGGSTPRRMHELLVSETLDWSRIDVWFGDERCVEPTHADSNYGSAHKALLSRVPIPAANVHRLRGECAPQHAADLAEAELARVAGPFPQSFDLLCVGMGADGHTLSLFPGTSALAVRERAIVANHVPHLGGTGAYRLTFTLPVVHAAREVLYLVCGADKRPMVTAATADQPGTTPPPAALARSAHGSTVWLVDSAAAP
jgi:6-phosphogluconolactonase